MLVLGQNCFPYVQRKATLISGGGLVTTQHRTGVETPAETREKPIESVV